MLILRRKLLDLKICFIISASQETAKEKLREAQETIRALEKHIENLDKKEGAQKAEKKKKKKLWDDLGTLALHTNPCVLTSRVLSSTGSSFYLFQL